MILVYRDSLIRRQGKPRASGDDPVALARSFNADW